MVNAGLDRLRRRAVRPTTTLPDHNENSGLELVEPRDAIAERENWIEISAALAELPQDQREAIILVDVQGYSVEAAAKELNCPTGTIKSRCSRGRAKLAESLGHLRNQDVGEIVTTTDQSNTRKEE